MGSNPESIVLVHLKLANNLTLKMKRPTEVTAVRLPGSLDSTSRWPADCHARATYLSLNCEQRERSELELSLAILPDIDWVGNLAPQY